MCLDCSWNDRRWSVSSMLSGLFSGRVFIHSPSHEKRAVIGMPSPKLQTWKRVHVLNNQTKTPNGVKTFMFIAWEPPLACLAWKMLITDGREVNKKGACLKISFIFVLELELWHLCKSLLPSAKGLSIYFYVVSSPSQISARTWEHCCHADALWCWVHHDWIFSTMNYNV